MSTNKRAVPPNGSAESEADHVAKIEKLGEDLKVKKETFDQETDEEETGGNRDVSALKQETDDEAEAKKEAAAVKQETDDEAESKKEAAAVKEETDDDADTDDEKLRALHGTFWRTLRTVASSTSYGSIPKTPISLRMPA